MRLRPARLALFAAVAAQLVGPHRPLVAQGAPSRAAAWLGFSAERTASRRVALLLDAQTRFMEVYDGPAQVLAHAGVAYLVGPRLRLSGGYGYRGTQAQGAGESIHLPEHRLWQAAQLTHRAGGVGVAHRARLEQRRMQLAGEAADGTPVHLGWATSHRFRYQLRGTLPLAAARTGGRLYLTAADELLAPFGGPAGRLHLDQNRATIALGVRASRTLRVEAGYLNQSDVARGPHLTVRAHVLQIAALSTAPLFSDRPSTK